MPVAAHRVGWGFISLCMLAYISTSLLFLAPLLVTLALKVNSLVGIEQAPKSLALVTGIGALLAMMGNPFFGGLSDRTTSPLGMRRPWMVIGLVGGSLGILLVALAPSMAVVLGGSRHLRGPAVHRQPAGHVPRPVRDRRALHPAVRGPAERPPATRADRPAITGVLFIITFVTSIPAALVLYTLVLDDASFIVGAGPDAGVALGAFLEVLLIVANVGTAVALFTILKRQNEPLALGYVSARLVECTFIAIGIVSLLAVVTLRQDFAGAAGGDRAHS